MVRSSWRSTFCAVVLQGSLCLALPAFAQTSATRTSSTLQPTDVPRTISYQGILTGTDGKPMHDGQYAITVRLYSDAEGVQAIYDATYQVTVVSGIFNIMLGSGHAPLPMLDKLNSPLWIGITVNGHEELKPYTALSASPYALNVPNNAISSDKLQDGSVTARKIGTDYIGSLWIDGEKVTDRGGKINLEGTNGIDISFDIARNTITFSGNGVHTNSAPALSSPEKLFVEKANDGNINGNLVANGNVDLGGVAANPSIKFTGKAASNLDMNSNSISNIGELFLGKAKSYSGSLSLYSATGAGRASIVSGPLLADHVYTVPDAGANAQFVLNEGSQTIGGTKIFTQAVVGNLNGNATSATSAQRAATADQIANSWVAGSSIISALMSNGGTLTNNTLGNAKTASLATMSIASHTAEQADQIANTFSGGASIERALKSYNKPVGIDITGTAAHASQSNEATHAASSDRAGELLNTFSAGASAASALKSWNGILTNSIAGNAASVTNGVYVSGNYNDPSWLSALAGSKIKGSVSSALTATNAQHAASSDHATNATNADHASTSDHATSAVTAEHSTSSDRATAAVSADHATTAGSVTNGLYSTGKYADPNWLTSLSAAKLIGAVPNADFATTAGSAAPSGIAGGNLGGTYPNPTVIGVDINSGASLVEAINHSTSTISALSIAKNLTISGGSINGSPIGMSMPAAGSFTTSQSTTTLGGVTSPVKGTRYADNNIVAWGDVAADGRINSQFGNVTITRLGAGLYSITLPDMPQASAVQITSQSSTPMIFSAQRLDSTITVRAFDLSASSAPADGAFYFLIVTRP